MNANQLDGILRMRRSSSSWNISHWWDWTTSAATIEPTKFKSYFNSLFIRITNETFAFHIWCRNFYASCHISFRTILFFPFGRYMQHLTLQFVFISIMDLSKWMSWNSIEFILYAQFDFLWEHSQRLFQD